MNLQEMYATTAKGLFTFHNVTRILLRSDSDIGISFGDATIGDGNGFYAVVTLNGPVSLRASSGDFELSMLTGEGELKLHGVKELSMKLNKPLAIQARTPYVRASAAILEEFYPLGTLAWKTGAYGENLNATSPISFSIALSDSYTFLKDITLGPLYTLDPPLIAFDESSTIPVTLFWIFLIIPIFLAAFLLRAKRKRLSSYL